MSVYLKREDAPPDSNFEPGALHHLVAGNAGRVLDPRRTPITIVDIRPDTGTFVLRIDDFEDKGARWEVPFEDVSFYQLASGGRRAEPSQLGRIREAVARFDRPLSIPCDPEARSNTTARIAQERQSAGEWLEAKSRFLAEGGELPPASGRVGEPRLYADLRGFMDAVGVRDIEEAFAHRYVSNPCSGDLVKGHRIVLAELGLVAYEGKVVRDPAIFDDGWSRERRASHIVARLAFVAALFGRLGLSRLVLHRGLSAEEPLKPPRNHSFVSASFSDEVARSHFEAGSPRATRALYCQAVPVERVFMTFYETAQMNEQFREAEAVLLCEEGNGAF